jgi:SAM-dependent methyltransferase
MSVIDRVRACLVRDDDIRSPLAHAAFESLLRQRSRGVLLSVGGGPGRPHPSITNLNIVLVENVDLVGTAYQLPFKDSSIAGALCEAVLEHLEFPDSAVAEMFRTLVPGGLVFAATPFLQAYHGYPDHFQNFTLRGHVRLFERAGFRIVSSGTCVGPTFAAVDLAAGYVRELAPGRFLSRALERLVRLLGRPVRLLDVAASGHSRSSMVCSTTFVLAERPPGQPLGKDARV